ncbi:hypothetical protein [Alteromonas macleodii]|uniref:hypothetical protein n=1 Tax=Alteromonas macleodii TaxID=28108 RepID=UPI0008594ED5|nr:hypothetical protein [Alteromonas macleodii]
MIKMVVKFIGSIRLFFTAEKWKTHDYTNRRLGHDFYHEGNHWSGLLKIGGWGDGLNVGDYLILPNGKQTTRYQILKIKYDKHVNSQWYGFAVFAPRRS